MKRSQTLLKDFAFNPLAKAPSKKYPVAAVSKQFNASQLDNGLYIASVEDQQSPISSLTLVLPTGSRNQSIDQLGAANWLKFNAFKATNSQSSIKITREAEIMGHSLSSSLSRENLFLQVDFRRDDLPDVVSLLGDVVDGLLHRDNEKWGMYSREFVRKSNEWRLSMEQAMQESSLADVSKKVMDQLHVVAFRRGLANPLYPKLTSSLEIDNVLDFCIDNIQSKPAALVGYGIDFNDLTNSANYYFGNYKFQSMAKDSAAASKYYGGEYVASADNGLSSVDYALAFNGASKSHSDYFTALVLKSLLGSSCHQHLKHGSESSALLSKIGSNGRVQSEAFSLNYSDAGLFGVYIRGDDASVVNESVKGVVSLLKSVASGSVEGGEEAVKRAVACAKVDFASELENGSRADKLVQLHNQLSTLQQLQPTVELLKKFDAVDGKKLSAFAQKLLKSKPSISTAGNPFSVVRADELGL